MDNLTKAKLKRLVQHSDWEVIYAFKSFLVEQWNKGEVKAEDEFNTLWNLAFLKGKIEGVDEFINSVEKLALEE